MKRNWTNYLFVFTILFFILGFINIVFSILGFLCMIIPFILLFKERKKLWCQKYCPRASLFNTLARGKSITGKTGPNWLTKENFKWFMLVYFMFNLFVITMSTIMVYRERISAMKKIRFLIAFEIPWDMPQLINIANVPDWVVHLSFRIYSIMFTTTVLGLILAFLFLPRTWCTICPVNTLSGMVLKKLEKITK